MRSACRVILGLCLFLCAGAALAQKSHSSSHSSHTSGPGTAYVHGYTRKDGTHVSPHHRGAPGTASSAGTIDVSGTGRSDLSEWAATHRMNSAAATTTARPSVSGSAASGNSIAWSHPSTVPKSVTSGGATTAHPSHTHTTTAGGTTGHHSKTYCSTCLRDPHGKVARSEKAKENFMRQTGYAHGRPGYVVDHIKPLACGGRDEPSNMQWQTLEAARVKDKSERKGCS